MHIFLAEKGIDCERVPIDIRAGENLTEEYVQKNPAGRVPVLELDDGTFIGEPVAICRYLESINADPCLFGEPGRQAAVVEMWNRRAELNFMNNVAMAFRNTTGFFKDRETCVKAWGEISAQNAADFLPMFDRQLESNTYLAGAACSMADITLCVALDFADQGKVVTLPDAPHVARWRALVGGRPSFSAR